MPAPAPSFSTAELARIAEEHFGLSGTLKPLPSERDQNARLKSEQGEYVLKITNPGEDAALIDMQEAALLHLAALGVDGVPQIVPTLTGAPHAQVMTDHGPALVRLVTWIAGTPLAESTRSPETLHALGRFMGGIARAMQGFGHPASFRADFQWSLDHVAQVAPLAADIAAPARRALVTELFDDYAANIAPRLPGLRAQVLHGDANDWNVIVDPVDPARIAGLIDFGDMCNGRLVNELAVTLAYALLDQPDLYAATRAVVAGFTAEMPLTEAEAELAFPLARMRLAASVAISSHQAKLQPDNDYLLISQAPAFALLERLAQIDSGLMIALCRKAAGFDSIPGAAALREHLASADPHPILHHDPRRLPRLALPTTGEHPDMPAFSDRAFDAWFTAQRPADLPEGLPFMGLGPYGEQRSIYTAAQFADAASEERRTRHMGVDTFLPPGTALYAPLAGVVESVTYNADPLDYGHTLILRHEGPQGEFFTLYGHLAGTLPDLLQEGAEVTPGQHIADIGDWSENGGWAPHLHFQIMTSLLQQQGNFFGVGHDSIWDMWAEICPDPNLILRLEPESYRIDADPPEAIRGRRARSLNPALSLSYREHLKIIRGRGPWLIDHTGRRLLDTVNNITHVGHCHPHVVAAQARQAAELNTNSRYLHELMPALAERIAATMPEPLSVVTFVNSGTEANELALRIARTALGGKKDTVVLDWAYHGNSGGTVEISPYKFKRKGGFPKPDFVQIATFPDPYRGEHRGNNSGPAYAADIERCLDAVTERTGGGAATFIAESVSGVGGQVVFPPDYLAGVYKRIRARGGLCIADEVQCGFGRLGTHFWGFEMQGVTPDIVVLGKPIGNGHPLAAVVTTPELAMRFANGMEYFNSFGGNPVSMAVGHAVLDVIEDEGLQDHARVTGDYLMQGFRDLAERFPGIGDVRGSGLFIGVEFVSDRDTRAPDAATAGALVEGLRLRGMLASTDGPDDNVLKIKPPMVFGRGEADILLAASAETLAALSPG